MPLDILAFVRKWNASTLTERSAAPQHFRDLCEALDVPHPTEEDQIGTSYTYEKHVAKTGGGEGFADVWKRGYFAWEYKSKGGDLKKAYKQINEYHEALENPPLLIVCDFVRFEVHTKFENLPSRVFSFSLDDLLVDRDTATSAIPPLEVLRHVFGDYNQLRPGVTSARVTEAAAADLLRLARQLELERAADTTPYTKEQIAHFLMRIVFCLFADSIDLIRNHAFRALIANDRFSPIGFNKKLPHLFEAMSNPGGFFGSDDVLYFNGDLFRPNDHILKLNLADLGILHSASQHDWSHIEPAIFGTLFERSLDASKRSMIGAHYTSTDDILLLVEPVVMQPLLRRWDAAKANILAALAAEESPTKTPASQPTTSLLSQLTTDLSSRPESAHFADAAERPASPASKSSLRTQPRLKLNRPALTLLQDFATELTAVRILDPACGSGNFLYVALKRLLDLWNEARDFGLQRGLSISLDPMPNPTQLFGIETDFYAHEIASIVVWIGFLQWKHDHGIRDDKEPLLQKLTNIEHADAIMRYDAEGKPYEPNWPAVDYIVGNPPFLGGNQMKSGGKRDEPDSGLGHDYVTDLRRLYLKRVPGGADLVTFWFERAREQIAGDKARRAGLLSTNSIRMVDSRPVLENILKTGNIFMAWSDRPWMLEGAAVRVSMIGFDDGQEKELLLNGHTVNVIYADLTAEGSVATALHLAENEKLCFQGIINDGPFELTPEQARKMLSVPLNVNGRPNSDVVKRRLIGRDVVQRNENGWLIDFHDMSKEEAALYELPFEYVKHVVKPKRDINNRQRSKDRWWLHGENRPGMRRAIKSKDRVIVTPSTAKYRLFVWMSTDVVPDQQVRVIARSDDYFLGVLQSTCHVEWSLVTGSTLESRPRYTATQCFETFPFPWPPGAEPSEEADPRVHAIGTAARELVRLRDNWLNPEKPSAVEPRQWETDLKKRTLTNLYNERPTWLANAHRTLDEAVFAAYGWPSNLTTQEILAKLLALNHERAATQAKPR